MHNITFFEVTEPKEAYRSAVNNWLTQLSQNAKPMTIDEMAYLTACNESHLFFLCIDNKIIGMSTLAVYRSPIGCKVWIEDVVVDKDYRGQGLGRTLIERTIKEAKRFAPLLTSANVTPVTHRSKCALSKHWVREKRNQCI